MKADSSTSRNAMTKTLLDYGFSKVNCKKLYNKDSIITTIKLDKAKNEQIDLYVVKDVNLIYEGKLDESLIEKEIILNDDFTPPVSKGSVIGYLIIKYNNEEYKYPLTAYNQYLRLRCSFQETVFFKQNCIKEGKKQNKTGLWPV